MSAPLELQKIGVKFFLADSAKVEPLTLIPVFHRWIQDQSVDGLLVDVADYSHLHHGPGIMLIAHEGDYSFDMAGGRPGLVYRRKQPLEGSFEERLVTLCRIGLQACLLLESDNEAGTPGFRGDEISLVANDRLAAPNGEETLAQLAPGLRGLATRLFGEGEHSVTASPVSEEPFSAILSADENGDVSSVSRILERLNS